MGENTRVLTITNNPLPRTTYSSWGNDLYTQTSDNNSEENSSVLKIAFLVMSEWYADDFYPPWDADTLHNPCCLQSSQSLPERSPEKEVMSSHVPGTHLFLSSTPGKSRTAWKTATEGSEDAPAPQCPWTWAFPVFVLSSQSTIAICKDTWVFPQNWEAPWAHEVCSPQLHGMQCRAGRFRWCCPVLTGRF